MFVIQGTVSTGLFISLLSKVAIQDTRRNKHSQGDPENSITCFQSPIFSCQLGEIL